MLFRSGSERHRWQHTNEDKRQIVAVFDHEDQMTEHAATLRDEEWKYVQDRFKQGRPKSILKFRQPGELGRQSSSSCLGASIVQPPSYSEPSSMQTTGPSEAADPVQDESVEARNKRQRVGGKFQGLQAADPESDEELPGYDQVV